MRKKNGPGIVAAVMAFMVYLASTLALFAGRLQGWLWSLVNIALFAILSMGDIDSFKFGKDGVEIRDEEDKP